MASRFKKPILLAVVLMLVALWGIADVVRGESGPEDLVWWVPLFAASLVSVSAMALHLRRRPGVETTPLPGAGTVLQREWQRVEKGVTALVTLLIVLYTAAWAFRTSDFALPLLTGSITLVVSWIFMLIVFRILRSKSQGRRAPTS